MKIIAVFIIVIASMQFLVADTPQLTVDEENLIENVKKCIINANAGHSKLPDKVLKIQGMSSAKVRHLLNNLCACPNSSYLEIGVWKGSTWISALYGNNDSLVDAIGIDNWSEFGAPKRVFKKNISKFIPSNRGRFYSKNAFSLPKEKIFYTPVNIYFYDGDHSASAQEQAFTYYNDVLDDVFIAIVDDWNFPPVPLGTYAAFNRLGYTVLYETVLSAKNNGDKGDWWNGLYIAVIRK